MSLPVFPGRLDKWQLIFFKGDVCMSFPANAVRAGTAVAIVGIHFPSQLKEENGCPLKRHQSPNTHHGSKSHPLIHPHAVPLRRIQIFCGFTSPYSSQLIAATTLLVVCAAAAWLDWQSRHERIVGDIIISPVQPAPASFEVVAPWIITAAEHPVV